MRNTIFAGNVIAGNTACGDIVGNRMIKNSSLQVKKLSEYAQLPSYGSSEAIGLDMYAELKSDGKHWRIINPGQRMLIPTGIAIAIPVGYYGRIAPRSGLALKNGIDVLAGVIDSDYRGEVRVILLNTGTVNFEVRHGDRIAQIIMERADRLSVNLVDNLDDTDRGEGGYGSTGR